MYGVMKMKNRLIAVAFGAILSLPCHAQTIAESVNKGGGKMVLTNEKCNDKKNYLAYSYMNGQPNLWGCWAYDDSGIHIRWYDGDFRTYPYDYWILNEKLNNNL